jgi:ribulose-5-phosphate 4-epimerase/fuculose-1-phosphate aldolase
MTIMLRNDDMLSDAEVQEARVDLAASFRWFARLGMHEAVSNHLSAAVSRDGSKFLMNPRGRHFSRVRASELLLLDSADPSTLQRSDAPDPTAWFIHGRLHALLPEARCIMHLHPIHTTALAGLEDSTLYPIDQNTMRFFGRVATDADFSGMALADAEGDRLAGQMGGKPILMMANHGLTITGPSIAMAFDEMYYFERAAQTLMVAYSSGQKLKVAPDEVARLTAKQWLDYPNLADDHLSEVKAILDSEEPDYRQ